MSDPSRSQSDWIRLGCLALLALVVAGYQAAANAFYQGFRITQGTGMNHLLPAELAHYTLYLFFGSVAAVTLWRVLYRLPSGTRLGPAVVEFCERPGMAPILAAALVLGVTLGLAGFVLGNAVTTDDEHVYRFIARTLRDGHLVAPSPGSDLEFFREQFVALDEHVRFGKYPIGHPLLLALGQAAGIETLVVPVLTALMAFPLHRVASRLFDRRVATLACVLFALSPQVWFTGATYLSQPSSALALLCGIALLVSRGRDAAPSRWMQLAAGACFGFGILVRPLPGVPVALAAAADLFFLPAPSRRERLTRVLVFAAPLVLAGLAIAGVNRAQTGSALVSGYQAFHAPGEGIGAVMGGGFAMAAMSVAASIVRANFWLFGWPLSLGACLLAGRLPRPWLLWGILAGELAYRVAAPKAGVGGAGPLYLFEAVPLLCVLAASGIMRLVRGETFLGARGGGAAAWAPAVIALFTVSFVMFVPPKLADLGRMGAGQQAVERLIARQGVHAAVVFHDGVVPPWTGLSWAYFPRCNGPRLDDDVLFLRFLRAGGARRNVELWRRRYPDRSAWYFGWHAESGPFLVGLEDFARMQDLEPSAPPPASLAR
jgi:Dolichyl-phosphate-mannose-protein mannosyltransferase